MRAGVSSIINTPFERKRMKRLIFDFDGTLVDSMPAWGGKMLYVLRKFGIDYPENIVEIVTPLGDRGGAQYFIERLGAKVSTEEMIAAMDEYALPKYAEEIPAKAGVEESLRRWKGKGYSLNVLTASPHRMLDVCLKRLGLYDLFDNVWSCEDFSMTKSDARIYEEVASRLSARVEECIFFDDNVHVLTVAKRVGMTVVGVYDESSKGGAEEIRALCDEYIFNFSEMEL